MTVFCITLFHMCAICVSCLWRAEIPHFICNRSLFVRLTRPSFFLSFFFFGMSKQSCRKAGFYILLWSFHGEVVIPAEREGGEKKKKDSSSGCFLSFLRLPSTTRFHLLVMQVPYCSATKPVRGMEHMKSAAEKTKGSDLNYRDLPWRSDPHLLGSFVPPPPHHQKKRQI